MNILKRCRSEICLRCKFGFVSKISSVKHKSNPIEIYTFDKREEKTLERILEIADGLTKIGSIKTKKALSQMT